MRQLVCGCRLVAERRDDATRTLTLSAARALARSYRTKVEAGIDPFAVVAAPLKFKDLTLMWLEDYAKPKRKTWEQDQRTLEVDVLRDAEGRDSRSATHVRDRDGEA